MASLQGGGGSRQWNQQRSCSGRKRYAQCDRSAADPWASIGSRKPVGDGLLRGSVTGAAGGSAAGNGRKRGGEAGTGQHVGANKPAERVRWLQTDDHAAGGGGFAFASATGAPGRWRGIELWALGVRSRDAERQRRRGRPARFRSSGSWARPDCRARPAGSSATGEPWRLLGIVAGCASGPLIPVGGPPASQLVQHAGAIERDGVAQRAQARSNSCSARR